MENSDTTRITYANPSPWSTTSNTNASGGSFAASSTAGATASITAAVDGSVVPVVTKSTTGAMVEVRRNGTALYQFSQCDTIFVHQVQLTAVSVMAGDTVTVARVGLAGSCGTGHARLDAFDMTDAVPADTTAPAKPAGFTGTASDGRADLSWTANTESDLAGYRLRRDTVKIAEPGKTSTAYADTTVTNGTTYAYELAAVDNAGNVSAWAGPLSLKPSAPPPPEPSPSPSPSDSPLPSPSPSPSTSPAPSESSPTPAPQPSDAICQVQYRPLPDGASAWDWEPEPRPEGCASLVRDDRLLQLLARMRMELLLGLTLLILLTGVIAWGSIRG